MRLKKKSSGIPRKVMKMKMRVEIRSKFENREDEVFGKLQTEKRGPSTTHTKWNSRRSMEEEEKEEEEEEEERTLSFPHN